MDRSIWRNAGPWMADPSVVLPPVVFPLSGPPVCATLGDPSRPGCLRSVYDQATAATYIELSYVVLRATTPAEKFYLEPSKKHDGLLHVRCSDGDKYWVAQQLRAPGGGGSTWFICATADEPEEDLTKPSCTLFDFRPDSTTKRTARFFHSQQKKYACMLSVSGPGKAYLQLRDNLEADSSNMSLFSVRRLSHDKELPKYVVFKGDNDPTVIQETYTDEYGVVYIKQVASKVYWRRGLEGGHAVNWMMADIGSRDYGMVDCLFKVVIKDDNYIAVLSHGNGKFCRRVTIDDKIDYFHASSDDGNTKEATFQIEEPVRSREIYDVEYRVGGKKTSTNKNVSRTLVLATNRTHETHNAQTTIELYDRIESTWDAKLTLDVGIKAKLSAGLPFLMEGDVESHLDFHGEYNWGETKIQETKRSIEYSYPVPPMTKVTCSIFSREDVVDVPFSYMQKDVLLSGEVVPPRQLHDGVYRGAKSTDVDIDTSEEKIT
ncbi:hypothetical protein CFC21_014660 [Triticum aestivum]|uniref:Agglutinin domain-containing protein n=2 Tax=Triticum aestivum TaxID=4565 RepID=A0A3B6AR86_WHEAT|nr:uncharacterized protein LOC123187037 isoform X2 [Triticum aestivum]KAF6998546.1 hypothetical protein CFC21_014660 [Triticum aestivum]